MYSYIKHELSLKNREIREIFAKIENFEQERKSAIKQGNFFANELIFNTLKGMIFISLYGCIEYTVSETVKVTEREISLQNLSLKQLKVNLLARFLHKEFDSLHSVGRKQKWQKRFDFLQKLEQDEMIITNICDDLELPTDGMNIRLTQLQNIFTCFNLDSSILTPQWGGRLKDIVDHRNAIAHGNKTANDVGKNIFVSDLKQRIEEVDRFCTSLIETFAKYLENQEYLL